MLGKKIYRGKAGRGQIGAKWQLSEMPTAAQASRRWRGPHWVGFGTLPHLKKESHIFHCSNSNVCVTPKEVLYFDLCTL